MKLLLKLGMVMLLVAGISMIGSNWDWIRSMAGSLLPSDVKGEDIEIKDEEAASSSSLDVVFRYLPFFGFAMEDVVTVDGTDIEASDGKQFRYRGNVLEVYELNRSRQADELLNQIDETHRISRLVGGESKEYLAARMDRYVIVIVSVQDPVALLELYEDASALLEKLGWKLE